MGHILFHIYFYLSGRRGKGWEFTGADPEFFLGGGALVSCSTSTPINHIVFFLQNTSCIRKPQVISEGGGGGVRTPCTLPLDPPLVHYLSKGFLLFKFSPGT